MGRCDWLFGRAGVTAAQGMPASSLHDWGIELRDDKERMHAGYVLGCAGSCRAAMTRRLSATVITMLLLLTWQRRQVHASYAQQTLLK